MLSVMCRSFNLFWNYFTWITLLLSAGARSLPSQVNDTVKIIHEEGHDLLKTAITSYQRGDALLDVIGVIHIADQSYYENLNKRLTSYDVVLFEMVSDTPYAVENKSSLTEDQPNRQANPESSHDPIDKSPLSVIGEGYNFYEMILGLSAQKKHINYQADNFVHADLSQTEFEQLQRKFHRRRGVKGQIDSCL